MTEEEKILKEQCGIPMDVEVHPLATIKWADAIEAVRRAKVFSPNAMLKVTSDSKENKKESEVAVCRIGEHNYCVQHFGRCTYCGEKKMKTAN